MRLVVVSSLLFWFSRLNWIIVFIVSCGVLWIYYSHRCVEGVTGRVPVCAPIAGGKSYLFKNLFAVCVVCHNLLQVSV